MRLYESIGPEGRCFEKHFEQSCVVWHSSLNKEDSDNLERVHNSAVKIKEDYSEYIDGLHQLNLDSLYEQRILLCKDFVQKTSKHEKLKHMFPKKEKVVTSKTRKSETYPKFCNSTNAMNVK